MQIQVIFRRSLREEMFATEAVFQVFVLSALRRTGTAPE